jgi:hypothetical protein
LKAVVLDEGVLQWMQHITIGQALDSPDLLSLRLDGEHEAGADWQAVNEYRTTAAYAMLATDMRPRQAAIVPNRINQSPARFDLGPIVPAIDIEGDFDHVTHWLTHLQISGPHECAGGLQGSH